MSSKMWAVWKWVRADRYDVAICRGRLALSYLLEHCSTLSDRTYVLWSNKSFSGQSVSIPAEKIMLLWGMLFTTICRHSLVVLAVGASKTSTVSRGLLYQYHSDIVWMIEGSLVLGQSGCKSLSGTASKVVSDIQSSSEISQRSIWGSWN